MRSSRRREGVFSVPVTAVTSRMTGTVASRFTSAATAALPMPS